MADSDVKRKTHGWCEFSAQYDRSLSVTMISGYLARLLAANQRWSLGFTQDAPANGRKFRTANLKDDCPRGCPAIDAALSLAKDWEKTIAHIRRVTRLLARL